MEKQGKTQKDTKALCEKSTVFFGIETGSTQRVTWGEGGWMGVGKCSPLHIISI
jgi:hypothetical protein